MKFVKVDVEVFNHPRFAELASRSPRRFNAAFVLYVRGLTYSGQFLTDGVVPKRLVRVWKATQLVSELVAVGLWEEVADGYLIHDFLDRNRSRAQVEAHRANDRKKKAKRQPVGKAKLRPSPGEHLGEDLGEAVARSPREPPGESPHQNYRTTELQISERDLKPRSPARAFSSPVCARGQANDNGASDTDLQTAASFVRRLQPVLPNIATHDLVGWLTDWAWLGRRPEAEQAAAIETLRRSAWVAAQWQRCTPLHLRKYWAVYAAGEEPRVNGGSSGKPGKAQRTVPVSSAEEIERLAALHNPELRHDEN